MDFRTVSTATACIFTALALTLIFVPGLIYWLFSIAPDTTADVIAKRAAMLFLGLSTLAFLSRSAKQHETRKIAAISISVALLGLALLGLLEFFRGTVGPGIFIAVLTEIAISLAYFRTTKPE